MKQYRPLLMLFVILSLGWTALIYESCGQQLKQIQKGTGRDQIPVTNGYQNTQVYRDATTYIIDTLGVMDTILANQTITDILYYIISGDTIGVYYLNESQDTTVLLYTDCETYPGLDPLDLDSQLNAGSQSNGSSISTANVGINTLTPVFTLDINATDGIRLPIGTTAERPNVPQAGVIRLNTTTRRFEGYNGIRWVNLSF